MIRSYMWYNFSCHLTVDFCEGYVHVESPRYQFRGRILGARRHSCSFVCWLLPMSRHLSDLWPVGQSAKWSPNGHAAAVNLVLRVSIENGNQYLSIGVGEYLLSDTWSKPIISGHLRRRETGSLRRLQAHDELANSSTQVPWTPAFAKLELEKRAKKGDASTRYSK